MSILKMGRRDLLKLHAMDVADRMLSGKEIIHLFRVLGGYWKYDYAAAAAGRMGLHAVLKSGRHTNGFLDFPKISGYENIRFLLALMLIKKIAGFKPFTADFVAGIPNGATGLGKDVAGILGTKVAEMEKQNGAIQIVSNLGVGSTLLMVEDVCSWGTGLKEATQIILRRYPTTRIIPVEPVVVNRGGLKFIGAGGVNYEVLALAEHRFAEWSKEGCPLCARGSEPIRPKEKPENWILLISSQS